MQILTKDSLSVYRFEDMDTVVLLLDKTFVYDFRGNLKLTILDCNKNNSKVFKVTTIPDDWLEHKYFFDGTAWSSNPDWIDPNVN